MNEYNSIAPIYDRLARLVFGSHIQKATNHFIPFLKNADHILILGGGSGQILKQFNTHQSIDYVDSSSSMLNLAKKRKCKAKVTFFHADFRHFSSQTKYDLVICPFFLDLFPEQELKSILTKIKSHLKDKGHLLVSDISKKQGNHHLLKKLLLQCTILFFRIFTKLKIKNLEDIQTHISEIGFDLKETKNFYHGMIFSSWWINKKH